MKLYYHKTGGGAEYLTDKGIENPNGSMEGVFDGARYIVRIDGNIRKDAELIDRDNPQDAVEPPPIEEKTVIVKATREQADKIAADTGKPFDEGGAYSSNEYTVVGWRECCRMLARRGFSCQQIEEIMRSKWTRWASDGSNNRLGRCTSRDLARFLDSRGITPEHYNMH